MRGMGIPMEPGMIGFRCNYATLSPEGLVTDRRAGRIHDTAVLSRAVQDGVDLSEFGVEFVYRSGGAGTGQPLPSKERGSATVSPQTIRKKMAWHPSRSSRSRTANRTKRLRRSAMSS